ncbi:MAG: hypothetical protein HYS25_05965 [Ignavibacteriales bacterium]|nr:hypothetical protein [Ignavibacteriales bacterium]
MKKFLLLFFVLCVSTLFAQTKDAEKILDAVKKKFDAVRDYEVDVSIKLDFEFVKMPDTKAKIYFKQPDKVKIDSKGFAMLPKQSLNFSPKQFLNGKYTAIYVKTETVDGSKLDVVKIIPESDSAGIVLSTLWIEQAQSVIRKIETTSKRAGTVKIELSYDNKNLGLPSQLKFTFSAEKSQQQNASPGNKDDQDEHNIRWRDRSELSGSVIVTYSNYKINKGMPDSFFEEKKK